MSDEKRQRKYQESQRFLQRIDPWGYLEFSCQPVFVKLPSGAVIRDSYVILDPPDPLDVEYDGSTLRDLLRIHQCAAREEPGAFLPFRRLFTERQRAAISAHWAAELRAKVAAKNERERTRVTIDSEDD